MKGRAILEYPEVLPGVRLDVFANGVEPCSMLQVVATAVAGPGTRLGISCPPQGRSERGLCQTQLVADSTGPDGTPASGRHTLPPKLARAALSDGLLPPGQHILLPDLHQAIDGRVAALGTRPLGSLPAAVGLGALRHHLLVFSQVSPLLCGVLGREPRRPSPG